MAGATITFKGTGPAGNLMLAEGLLLTLTDSTTSKSARERAVRSATSLLETKETDPKKVARALATHIDRQVQERRLQEAPAPGPGGNKMSDAPEKPSSIPAPKGRGRQRKGGGKGGPPGDSQFAGDTPKDKDFEKLHPRGRGGIWIKKGDGTGKEGPQPEVSHLQKRLQQLGYGPGAADGQFGALTEEALMRFQDAYGLNPTGQVDPATLATLQSPPEKTVAQAQQFNREQAQMPNAQGEVPGASKAGGTRSTGAGGGGGQGAGSATTLDTANPETVKRFQQAHGLTVDGIVGPETTGAMRAQGVASLDGKIGGDQPQTTKNEDGTTTSAQGAGADSDLGVGSRSRRESQKENADGTKSTGSAKRKGKGSGKALKLGMGVGGNASPGVKVAQQVLTQLGYDTGGVDGRFGPDTKKAVQKLQRKYGLPTDGVIGPKTDRLIKRLAKKTFKDAKDKSHIGSADEIVAAATYPEDLLRTQEMVVYDARVTLSEAERSGDVETYIRTRADLMLQEGVLHRFSELLHPRGRGGQWVDAPDRMARSRALSRGASVTGKYSRGDTVGLYHHGRSHVGKVLEDKGSTVKLSIMHGRGDEVIEVDRGRITHHRVPPKAERAKKPGLLGERMFGGPSPHPIKPAFKEGEEIEWVEPHGRTGHGRVRKASRDRHGLDHYEVAAQNGTMFISGAYRPRKRSIREALVDRQEVALEEARQAREGASCTRDFIEARAREETIAAHIMESVSPEYRKKYATVRKGGKDKYPIAPGDKKHAKAALLLINKSDLTPEEKAKVRAKAKRVLAEVAFLEEWVEADDFALIESLGGEEIELEEAKDSLRKASQHKHGLETKKGDQDNWVERSGSGGRGGQLPAYIQHIALAIVRKRGMPKSQAIAIAVGTVKRWARGGGDVDSNTRAAARKALKEWEAMKAKAHAT